MIRIFLALAALTLATPALAQSAPAPIGKQQVETYRIAPGKQKAFLAFIARCDEANRLAGLPPRQLFVHSDGASWDFLLLQPYDVPADKEAALDAAWKNSACPRAPTSSSRSASSSPSMRIHRCAAPPPPPTIWRR